MPYQEMLGSQDQIEQSNTLAGCGLVCSSVGFQIIKIEKFVTWRQFLSKDLQHFAFNSSYQLTASQLRYTSWYYMSYVDSTPRLYAINKENNYICLEGGLARTRFKQLSTIPQSCIDRELNRLYPQFWAIYGYTDTSNFRAINDYVVYGRKKTRRSRGGKKHKR
jgi:hypothetical protein